MSFLALAFGLGALAIGFPLLFHLIRPTPRGRQEFSSLMFLKTSPPRLTRRSRFENWLLLLIRCTAVGLLAIAFMRPFFRENAEVFSDDLSNRRVAIVLDVSASMRRTDLWNQAQKKVEHTLEQLEPGDDVGLFTFGNELKTLVGFEKQTMLELPELKQLIRQKLTEIAPAWGDTNLGQALVATADALVAAADQQLAPAQPQLVLISDLQEGCNLNALQAFEWPDQVRVEVLPVSVPGSSNATVKLVASDPAENLDSEVRVRVTNAADSSSEQFFVQWENASNESSPETAFYVPPGQNRTLRVKRDEKLLNASRLVLTGDSEPFDNSYFVVPVKQQVVNVIYFGDDDENDADGLQYFLRRALADNGRKSFEVQQVKTSEPLAWPAEQPALVVLTRKMTSDEITQVEEYLEDSGTVLVVLKNQEVTQSLGPLAGVVATENDVGTKQDGYSMLADIDFAHPLFQPFANPRYNDFTNIRFWNHQRVKVGDNANIVASFDDRWPAIWQSEIGNGTLIGFSAGWHPEDSQLALSTKFVPIIAGILSLSALNVQIDQSGFVNRSIQLPVDSNSNWTLQKPDGSTVRLAADQVQTDPIESPGICKLYNDQHESLVAINLTSSESATAAMPVETLETYNVRLGSQPTTIEQKEQLRQIKDTQLEARQQIWKWLVVLAVALLVVETILAGRLKTKPTDTEVAIA